MMFHFILVIILYTHLAYSFFILFSIFFHNHEILIPTENFISEKLYLIFKSFSYFWNFKNLFKTNALVTITLMYLLKWVHWFTLCMDYYITSLLQNFYFFFFSVYLFSIKQSLSYLELKMYYVWNIFQAIINAVCQKDSTKPWIR